MSSRVGPNDRLGITLLLASVLHAVAVLGVSFTYEAKSAAGLSTLDVILVQTRTEEAPEKADFLAQANQQGGGDSDKAARPAEPFTSLVPKPDPGIAPTPVQQSSPPPSSERQQTPEVLTQREASVAVVSVPSQSPVQPSEQPSARELIERNMEMARLQAEINRNSQAYAKRPKRKFISANTREYDYAEYMQTWVAKVERVGNINYPEEARRRDLNGSLVLTVAIRRDGSVEGVEIIQASGESVLDDAARQIVAMASPFAPLPTVAGEQIDVLHITRTWQYLPGNVLQSQ